MTDQAKPGEEPQDPQKSPGDEPQGRDVMPPSVDPAAPAQQMPAPAAPPPSTEPKPYDEVIAGEALTQKGFLTVHQVQERWYFELGPQMLDQDLLWYAEFAESPPAVALNPRALGQRIVRWERQGKHILLRDRTAALNLRPAFAAAPQDARALDAVSLPAVLFSFPIAAYGEGDTAVIDVTTFFTQNLLEFDASMVLKAAGYMATVPDPLRSRVERINAFPENVLVLTLLTFGLAGGASSAASIGIAHSLVRLPDPPMMPRYADSRVGYFTTEYGVVSADDAPGIVSKRIISRFRLEKKRLTARISKPVKPIVFYLPQEIPSRWRPYVRQGVEDWQPAFETAGFREAIVARDAPGPDEDPDWHPADARYSVIRWVPQRFPNAMGPHLADPRSGEIISAHVIFWDDVLKIAQTWYFSQVSAVDERARQLPLDEKILGAVIRYIVCHEVGHSLGLRHNHRASQAFTTEQLRDPTFADKHGPVASIMSYGRFNYVTQPGDGVRRLIPQLGPYDYFAINWGYRPIPEAASPQEERPLLDEWAAAVKENSWLAFGGEDTTAQVDPTVLTENIGADRIESARLGIANLERMLEFLVPATTREHEGFELLDQMYHAILNNRTTWLVSAAKELGGVVEQRTLDPEAEAFRRVPTERQEQIVAFLLKNLRRAEPFLRPEIVNRIAPFNAVKPVMDSQTAVLDSMLAGGIYKQIMDASVLDPDQAYQLIDYLGHIQDGLFAEIEQEEPQIDPIMRTLQRHYLTTMKQMLAAYESGMDPMLESMLGALGMPVDVMEFALSKGQGTDLRNAARSALRGLRGEIAAALERVRDGTTKAHLEDLQIEVVRILEGNG